jgi:hypothetical protein
VTAPRVGWRPSAYDPSVASVRLRSLLPVELLRRAGVDAELLPENATAATGYDCVVFQKAYSPADLRLATELRRAGTRVVFDLCDNHLYNPDGSPWLAARADRLREMLGQVDAVTVPTAPLVDLVAETVPGLPVHRVDDALEVPEPRGGMAGRWDRIRRPRSSGTHLRLVWFGNAGSAVPEFGLVHLGAIVPELEALHRERPIELTVVSNSRPLYEQYVGGAAFPTRYVRWRPQSFHHDVSGADVCVLPVVANPFTIGKTSNRLVVALELGVPVVAGDIPSYREFDAWIGIDDWKANIAVYAADPDLAARHVAGGRAQIRELYSDERITRQWQDAIRSGREPGA